MESGAELDEGRHVPKQDAAKNVALGPKLFRSSRILDGKKDITVLTNNIQFPVQI
jgi:hypothetical protein